MMPQPGAGGGGLDIGALLQLLMQILSQPGNAPAGEVANGIPGSAPPPAAMSPSPEQQQMAQIHQMAQMLQMQQSGQQSQNAVQGGAGAPFGAMGGRPPGS